MRPLKINRANAVQLVWGDGHRTGIYMFDLYS